MDVVIGIGFDGAEHPEDFLAEVQQVITRLGTLNAVIRGQSWSPLWGSEPGAWFAASFDSQDRFIEARTRILVIGATHSQDAIAFTQGNVDVAPCPVPEPKRYRHLL